MQLNKLSKTTARKQKRVGRGIGSGKGGHTSGRGQKGQKTRDKVKLMFEGTKMRKSLIRRLPMMRGKLRLKPRGKEAIILNVKYLNLLKDKAEVTVESLIKAGLVSLEAKLTGVKILGDGELKKALTVMLPVSKGARAKIEKAGGKVVEATSRQQPVASKRVEMPEKAEKVKTEKKPVLPKKQPKVKKVSVKKLKAKKPKVKK